MNDLYIVFSVIGLGAAVVLLVLGIIARVTHVRPPGKDEP